jgi:uncharacterized protein (DUF433 family)
VLMGTKPEILCECSWKAFCREPYSADEGAGFAEHLKRRGRFQHYGDGSQRSKRVCMQMMEELIVSDPDILSGMSVIKGTRVPVHDLAASVRAGIPRVAYWQLIPLSRSTIWIWLSLTQRPIHCRGRSVIGFLHGQEQRW